MTARLSRKRKKWLRRHVPLGAVNDPVVMNNPTRRWGRQSFIAERGHGKGMWAKLWSVWAPCPPEGALNWRFVLTEAWFATRGRQMPKQLRGTA